MIFNEEEIRELGREKRVTFAPKKKEKQKPQDNSLLVPVFAHIMDLVGDVKKGVSKIMGGFNSVEEKIDAIKEAVNKKPEPEAKKPDKWDFKIIRNLDNQIQKIEATRKE
jgi:hypothetical protein